MVAVVHEGFTRVAATGHTSFVRDRITGNRHEDMPLSDSPTDPRHGSEPPNGIMRTYTCQSQLVYSQSQPPTLD
jgi:hypothetical protein